MVIIMPIAGRENSKRWSGFSAGTERQATRSRRAASRVQIRNPKPETRRKAEGPKSEGVAGSNIVQDKKKRPALQAGHETRPNAAAR
jgi:hypothetical protein